MSHVSDRNRQTAKNDGLLWNWVLRMYLEA